MCIHVQRNGPVSRMRDLCMLIPEDKRILLSALIKLFSQVCVFLLATCTHNYIVYQTVDRKELAKEPH